MLRLDPLQKGDALWEHILGDLPALRLRELLVEPVHMVLLAVKLLAAVGAEAVRLIEIVEPVPLLLGEEPALIPGFQKGQLIRPHTGKAQLFGELPGVPFGGGKAGVHVPRTHRHGIAAADALKDGPGHQRVPGDGKMGLEDVAPLEGDPRRVVADSVGTGRKIGLQRLDVPAIHRDEFAHAFPTRGPPPPGPASSQPF